MGRVGRDCGKNTDPLSLPRTHRRPPKHPWKAVGAVIADHRRRQHRLDTTCPSSRPLPPLRPSAWRSRVTRRWGRALILPSTSMTSRNVLSIRTRRPARRLSQQTRRQTVRGCRPFTPFPALPCARLACPSNILSLSHHLHALLTFPLARCADLCRDSHFLRRARLADPNISSRSSPDAACDGLACACGRFARNAPGSRSELV